MAQEGQKDPDSKPEKPETKKAPEGTEAKTGQQGPSTPVPLVQPIQPAARELVQEKGENIVEVNDLNWEKTVEKGKLPVAVMFYSPTCAYCHQMEPYFRGYAKEFTGIVAFARLDIMTSLWTAERYGVRSTPTFKLFCDGKPVKDIVGAVYPAILKKAVDEVLVHGKDCAKVSGEIDYEITGYG